MFHSKVEAKVGNVFRLGDLRLRIVSVEFETNSIVVQQEGYRAAIWQRWNRVINATRWLRVRIVMTAWVWGLARHNDWARTIQWSDIYAVDWLARLFERLTKKRTEV
jgi:hypothetical protein